MGGGPHVIERFGESVCLVGKEMPVEVVGDLDRGMPELPFYKFGIRIGPDHRGRRRVAEVVSADSGIETHSDECGLQDVRVSLLGLVGLRRR